MELAQEATTAKAKTGKRQAGAAKALSHNLNGQRLGRKGRDTRDRIIAATQSLLDGPRDVPITLSAVAREASLGMTSLYSYFNDLTELLLAALEPVMAQADQAYIGHLRARWPDGTLNAHCLEFVSALHGFWQQNSRILHLRNHMADQQDKRMMEHRVAAARPIISLLVAQMDQNPANTDSQAAGMATVLYTGIERVVTVATDTDLPTLLQGTTFVNIANYIKSEARLLELGIRDYRGPKAA